MRGRHERQYEHIKESAEERGFSKGRAKEIASRTVNTERARSGEYALAAECTGRGHRLDAGRHTSAASGL